MRISLPGGNRTLRAILTLGSAAAIAGLAAPVSAQWTVENSAKSRCADQLTYQLSQEAGGSNPDSGLDSRAAQVRQVSALEMHVTGNGWYRRDAYDPGRPYEYSCVFNSRTGAIEASHRWTGNAPGVGDYTFQGSGGGSVPNGRITYTGPVTNVGSKKALDVEGESTKDSADVRQWSFRNRPSQLWDVVDAGGGRFIFVNQGSNKVLDVSGPANRNGAEVLQYRYNGSDEQLWRIERVGGGAFQFVNVGSGKCLDVQASSKEEGANVRQWKCVGSPNQAWRLGQ
jgi:hypothetical protein